MTDIFTLDKEIKFEASYSISPKEALIAFIMQTIFKNFNTWEYPEIIEGMWESETVPNHWYYNYGQVAIIANPRKGGNYKSTTHHTSVMGLHLPCSTSTTPTF